VADTSLLERDFVKVMPWAGSRSWISGLRRSKSPRRARTRLSHPRWGGSAPKRACSSARWPTWARSRHAARTSDARADVWAFGCVVWECLTGKALFGGATLSDTIGAL